MAASLTCTPGFHYTPTRLALSGLVGLCCIACTALPPARPPTPTWAELPPPEPTHTLIWVESPSPGPASPTAPIPTNVPPLTETPLSPTAPPPPPTDIPTPLPPTKPPPTSDRTAAVTVVVDGDTIEVSLGGTAYRVRYIGINTPETDEPCGGEATAANAALVANQIVTLVKDVSETDRYGRLLRYVYVGEVFVNAELVAGGWAEAVRYPPDLACATTFEQLAAQAKAANLGCWPSGVFGDGGASTPHAAIRWGGGV